MKTSIRLAASVVLILVLFMFAGPGQAADAGNIIIHHIESVVNEDGDTFTVTALLSALDDQKSPLTDLTQQDFTILEDGQTVEIESIEVMRDLPINVLLVMDISGSMQGDRLTSARTAISQFIKSLYRGDKVAVYTFNTEFDEIVPLTEDLNQAQQVFDNAQIYAGGGTCLFDAVYTAAQLAGELPPGRQAVVALSDGWDTISGSDVCSTHTVADIIALATGNDVHIPIYTIGIGTDIDRESLGEIAEETGGVFTQSTVNTDLPALFEQVANRLSSQYQLSYISGNSPGGHRLTIQLRGASVEQDFSLPGLPPVISIAYPEEGQVLDPGVNTIKLSLSERGIPIDTLAFKLNGVAIGVGGQVGQPPYEYDIDFSQYDGQEVEMTILALDKSGNVISETISMMNLTGAPLETGVDPGGTAETESAPRISETCPEGMVCLGNLQLSRTQILIIGGVLLAVVVAVILVIFFSKKKKPGQAEKPKKESLFDDATLDGFALPGSEMGRLTILSSDDPLMVGKEFQLTKSPTVIGRSVNNDIALPKDSAVSRQHVRLIEKDGQTILQEVLKTLSDGTKQSPTYGTYVNDRKVTGDLALHTGDEIALGRRTKLRYEGKSQPVAEAESEDVTMDQINLPDFRDVDDATRDG